MMLRVNSGWCALRGGSRNRRESQPPSPARFVLLTWHSRSQSFKPLRCLPLATPSCQSDAQKSSPSTSIEDLRRQLEVLHLEAEQARGRANAARARFMRLTETVENLRMLAITDLKSGKEGSARQLIAEKQKVMQALEKSKQRSELLEELCTKLGEAISSKELQIMASLSSTSVGVDESNTTTLNVRIVSPKPDDLASDWAANREEIVDLGREDGRVDLFSDYYAEASRPDILVVDNAMEADDRGTDAVNAMLSTRAELYPNFLSRIDNHLHEAEVQLHGFLNIAAMVVPADVDKNTNEKVAVVKRIWQDVLVARGRIRKAVQQEDFG